MKGNSNAFRVSTVLKGESAPLYVFVCIFSIGDLPIVQVRRLRLFLQLLSGHFPALGFRNFTPGQGSKQEGSKVLASLSATQLRRFEFLDFLISIRGVEALEMIWGSCSLIL